MLGYMPSDSKVDTKDHLALHFKESISQERRDQNPNKLQDKHDAGEEGYKVSASLDSDRRGR